MSRARPGGAGRARVTLALFFLQLGIFLLLVIGEKQSAWHPSLIRAAGVGDAHALLERPWSLLTYALVNLDPFELVGSGLLLLLLGPALEQRLGRARLLLVYFLGGALCGLAHVALQDLGLVDGPLLLGSTGASAGLLSAYLFLLGRERRVGTIPFPAVYPLAAALLVGLVTLVGSDTAQQVEHDRAALVARATGEQATVDAKLEAAYALAALEVDRRDVDSHLLGLVTGAAALFLTLAAAQTSERYRVFREIRGLQAEVDARARVEELLEKISREGMASLTRNERKFLRYASRFYQTRAAFRR